MLIKKKAVTGVATASVNTSRMKIECNFTALFPKFPTARLIKSFFFVFFNLGQKNLFLLLLNADSFVYINLLNCISEKNIVFFKQKN